MKSKAEDLATSIENFANQPTERKMPSTASTEPYKEPVTVNENSPPEFFGKEEETEDIEQEKISEQKDKASAKAIDASGKTGAFLIGGTIELAFDVTERLIYISKFTNEEKNRIALMGEKTESEYDEYDININRKFLAITKKHDKIKEKIPLTDKENEALATACAEYTRVTGKSLNPNIIIWSTIAKIFIGRSIDIFL